MQMPKVSVAAETAARCAFLIAHTLLQHLKSPLCLTQGTQRDGISTKRTTAYCIAAVFAAQFLCAETTFGDIISTPLAQYGYGPLTSNIACSPDGTRLLMGSGDCRARIFDASTGLVIRTFEGHTAPVTTVAFSPDGRKILTGSEDKTAKLWDETEGNEIQSFVGHTDDITSAAFSPNGTYVLTGGDVSAKLWNITTGAELRSYYDGTAKVTSVAFSPDGRKVLLGILGSATKSATLFETSTGNVIRGFSRGVTGGDTVCVAFSPSGESILVVHGENVARLYNVLTGELLHTFTGHTAYVRSVAFSPDGSRIATGSNDNTIKLWNTETGSYIRTFSGHWAWVTSVTFSPDGQCIYSTSRDNTARGRNVDTAAVTGTFYGHTGWVYSVSSSPSDCSVLLGMGWQNTGTHFSDVELWDYSTGTFVKRLATGLATGVGQEAIFSPDGRKALVMGSEEDVILKDIDTGMQIHLFSNAHPPFAFSPDGTKILTNTSLNTVTLWDVETGAEIRTLSGGGGTLYSLAFSPDSRNVLIGSGWYDPETDSYQGVAKLLDAQTGALIHNFTGHENYVCAVGFSPDGTKLLTGSNDFTAKLWYADTFSLIHTFSGHTGAVNDIAFSPDGTKILTGSYDKTAKLWDTETGLESRSFIGHTKQINSVAFSLDGESVFTGSSDYTMRQWSVSGIVVPDVIGESLSAAESTLNAAGLEVGSIIQEFNETVPEGMIIRQAPGEGVIVPIGSVVDLTVSIGEPITGSIIINNNRSATNSEVVALTLTWAGGAGSGVSRMRFSDNGATWSPWETLRSTRSYTLPSGDSHKTVRVQFIDKLNNKSDVFSDYIRLDTMLPVGSIVINGGTSTTSNPVVTLSLDWKDGTGSGVTRMRFSDNGSTWTSWMIPRATRSHTLPLINGYHTVRVQYLDGANNYSSVFKDYIKLQIP